MRRILRLAVMTIPALFAFGAAAGAQNAYTTGNVNMRVAPGAIYPRITTIPVDSDVTVHGCNQALTWCDTSWARYRGWVSARYLASSYEGRRVYLHDYGPRIGIPIITFSFGTYWDRHYRNQHWYRDRDRWHRQWQGGGDREWRGDRPRDRDGDRRRDRDRNADRDNRDRDADRVIRRDRDRDPPRVVRPGRDRDTERVIRRNRNDGEARRTRDDDERRRRNRNREEEQRPPLFTR